MLALAVVAGLYFPYPASQNERPKLLPVAFEAAVLLAGFGSVFALFAVSRLYPGKQSRIINPRVTDDRFVLVIDESDSAFDADEMNRLFREFHVVDTEERLTCGRDTP